jgi:hypothetical protein
MRTILGTLRTAALATVIAMSNALPAIATDVTTHHNDQFRTGANTTETVLTPAAVSARGLSPVWRAVDANLETQPLYVRGVRIAGLPRDVVFTATTANSVYAFDANDRTAALTAGVLWRRTLADPNPRRARFRAGSTARR